MGSNIAIRRALATDADKVADIFVSARARMTYLPVVHTEAETRAYFRGLQNRMEVWVAEMDGRVVGFAGINEDWLDHLYVYPDAQSGGAGSALLDRVKVQRPAGFQLWAFQQNDGARRFYSRHGCVEVEWTNGEGNEERTPDVRFEWRP